MMVTYLRPCYRLPFRRFICKSSAPDLAPYKETFARRMAMAGIEAHHRIAIGVSGGPDSMALCVLTSDWKSDGLGRKGEGSGYIEGLLGIVVDHRLRTESAEEANLVRERVIKMGIRCEIECCDWISGRPKLGHLQEAARDMRYQIFQDVCIQQKIGILLIAQHADDQAELFILRLSRKSGIFGLAGMAFVSQLFPTLSNYNTEGHHSVVLVRPMLEFSKDDMYNICQGGHEEWVEDPTNQSILFARNRLRISLRNISSPGFKLEMQRLLAACRLTRSYVESICYKIIEHSVTIADHGYAIIDLEKLKPSNVEDLFLSKFLLFILQFISQKHKPIRGSVTQLLLGYIRRFPCKTSLDAAGCYLCAAPGSKGSKVLVCCSLDSLQSSGMPFSSEFCYEHSSLLRKVDEIVTSARAYSDQLVQKACNVHFLQSKSSGEILSEAKENNLISESTFASIDLLEREEHKNFTSKTAVEPDHCSTHAKKLVGTSRTTLHCGQSFHFMERFLVTWKHRNVITGDGFAKLNSLKHKSGSNQDHLCDFCMVNHENSLVLRHMVDSDWLYLAELSKGQVLHADDSIHKSESNAPGKVQCFGYIQAAAHKALQSLKSIPLSARRSLPVVVNSHDQVLSIPSICFSYCPNLSVIAVFRPRVPRGGGYSSYI